MPESPFGIKNVVVGVGALFLGILIGHWASGGAATASAPKQSTPVALTATTQNSGDPESAPTRLTPPSSAKITATAPDSKPAAAALSMGTILRERDTLRRTRAIQDFVEHLDPASFAEAVASTGKLPNSPDREFGSRLLVERWAAIDPDAALAYAMQNRRAAYMMGGTIFSHLAATDAQGALVKAQALPEGDLRTSALRGVITYQAQEDPARAMQMAQSLGKSADPLVALVLREWAGSDPQAAGAQALQSSGDREGEVSQVVRTWAGQDPVAALAWSRSLPDPAVQARAVSQGVRQWAEQDATSAATWLNTVPPGPARDAAVASFTSTVAWNDPKDALVWAQSISDESQRNQQLQRIGRTVLRRDPQNGPAMLQAAGLPQDFVQAQPRGGRRRDRQPGTSN